MNRSLAVVLAIVLASCGSSTAAPLAEETRAEPAAPDPDPAAVAPPEPAREGAECSEASDCPPGRVMPAYIERVECVEHRCVYSGHVTDPEAQGQ